MKRPRFLLPFSCPPNPGMFQFETGPPRKANGPGATSPPYDLCLGLLQQRASRGLPRGARVAQHVGQFPDAFFLL